jgi:hypothetical protein
MLVAEGSTFAEKLPTMNSRDGFSALYPTVYQTYDPADPLNEAKYGRATANRPVIQVADYITGSSSSPARYLAIRGFKWNPGNITDQASGFIGSAALSNSFILLENNIFAYTAFVIQQDMRDPPTGFVIRGNSFYGSWSGTDAHGGLPLYLDSLTGITVEDNIFYHGGWKIGASRDDSVANGGATIYRHSIYLQDNCAGIVRRNLSMDASATGFSVRGSVQVSDNVSIDNPIGIIAGEGTAYNLRPIHRVSTSPSSATPSLATPISRPPPHGEPASRPATGGTAAPSLITSSPAAGTPPTSPATARCSTPRSSPESPNRATPTSTITSNISGPRGDLVQRRHPERRRQRRSVPRHLRQQLLVRPCVGNQPQHLKPDNAQCLYGVGTLSGPWICRQGRIRRSRPGQSRAPSVPANPHPPPGGLCRPRRRPRVPLGVPRTSFYSGGAYTTPIIGALESSVITAAGLPGSVAAGQRPPGSGLRRHDQLQFATNVTLTETPSAGSPRSTIVSLRALAPPTLGALSFSPPIVSGTPSTGTVIGYTDLYSVILSGAAPSGLFINDLGSGAALDHPLRLRRDGDSRGNDHRSYGISAGGS